MLKYADSFAAQIATSPLMQLTPADITSPSFSLSSRIAAHSMCRFTTMLRRSQSAGIGFGGASAIASVISISCLVVSSAFAAAFFSSALTAGDGAMKRSTENTSTRLSTTVTWPRVTATSMSCLLSALSGEVAGISVTRARSSGTGMTWSGQPCSSTPHTHIM